MKKYQVFDGDKPADCHNHKVHSSWKTSIFNTFEEARTYAWKWLAPYGGTYDGASGIDLQVNTPADYSGMGTMIEIKEIEV